MSDNVIKIDPAQDELQTKALRLVNELREVLDQLPYEAAQAVVFDLFKDTLREN